MASEADKNRRLAEELSKCQMLLSQREKEMADLKARLQAVQNELERLQPDHARVHRDYEETKRR